MSISANHIKRPPKAERRRLTRLYKEVQAKRAAERSRALARCNTAEPGTPQHVVGELGRRKVELALSWRTDPIVIDSVLREVVATWPVYDGCGDPYPTGERMYWRCTGCGSHINTMPVATVHCLCDNMAVELTDDGYTRLRVSDEGLVSLVELHGCWPANLKPRSVEETRKVVERVGEWYR